MSNSHLKTLLTQTQTDILFGEALANPDEGQFPLGDDEIIEAVKRFLIDRDRCAKLVEQLEEELECRKSHTDTEIGELKAENEKLKKLICSSLHHLPSMEEENKKLKTQIEVVWVELYAQDKYGCEVSWKSIADLIEYDEEKAKKLYEEEYPEDDE